MSARTYINTTCKVGQGQGCGRDAAWVIAVTWVTDNAWSNEAREGGAVALCDFHATTPVARWDAAQIEGESPADVLDGTGVTANTWQSAARRLAAENERLREQIGGSDD